MKTKRISPARTDPDDFIGKIYKTNRCGDIEIIDYHRARDVTVRFVDSGYTRKTDMPAIRNGAVTDHSTSFSNNKQLYGVWGSMKDRCLNSDAKAFKDYGARGITVHEDWRTFNSFKLWADRSGYSEGLEIDRIDNDSGYSPENCRWVERRQNCRNRRAKSKFGHCIYQNKGSSTYHVRVHSEGKLNNLGTFKTIKEAEKARDGFLGGYSH